MTQETEFTFHTKRNAVDDSDQAVLSESNVRIRSSIPFRRIDVLGVFCVSLGVYLCFI
jgi:hypothetical protein